MKRLLIVFIVVMVVLTGCTINSSQQKVNDIPTLTREEALNLVSKASGKVHAIVDYAGADIGTCTSNSNEKVEINGIHYILLSSCVDTVEEFEAYYDDVLTKNSIEYLMNNGFFKVREGKVLRMYADRGGGLLWSNSKIITLNQNGETALVEFKVSSSMGRERNRKINYKYIENKGWRIDIENPMDLY